MSELAVSVVVTVYNKEARLPATLACLRRQLVPESEIVCVDDASADASLEVLRRAALEDGRIRIIENTRNRGPAIRLNQGVEAARGKWLHLIDGDDIAAPNAQAWMLGRMMEAGAPLLYGRRRRGVPVEPIPADARIEWISEPLAFCAGRPVVHMALMVERDLFLAAHGADPSLFVQDQSLPLRLARRAHVMLWTEAAVCFAPPSEGARLSDNTVQTRHDSYFSVLNMLRELPPTCAGNKELRQLATSTLFKLEREQGRRTASTTFAYIRSKLGSPPSAEWLSGHAPWVTSLDGVRHPLNEDAQPPPDHASASARRSTAPGGAA